MSGDGADGWGPPPPIAPKRRNAVLRLYDAPVYRDWAVWSTVGWFVIFALAIGFSPKTNDMPKWLDGLLAGASFSIGLGVIPAIIRLQFRRWRWRRRIRDNTNRSGAPNAKTQDEGRSGTPQDATLTYRLENQTQLGPDSVLAPQPVQRLITTLSTNAISSSEILLAARTSLQYPIARSVRSLQMASDPSEQYVALFDVSEAITLCLAATGAAWMRQEGFSESLIDLHRHYQSGVSQGTWHTVIKAWERQSAGHPRAVAGSLEGLKTLKGGKGLLADLRTLLEERNRWAHGARPHGKAEAAARVAEFFPPLELALQRSQFMRQSPWILTRGVSFRRRHSDFAISAQMAMGDHPEFDSHDFVSSRPLADETFYALTNMGALDLTPFVVMRYCKTCHQREMCHADRVDSRQGVSLKSFANGHVIYDADLVDELSFTRGANEGSGTG